jgi:hypothetical protein
MASGMMGTLRLNDEDGKPMLVKGRVVKVTEKVEEKVGKDGKTAAEVFRDRFVSTVAILCQSGIEIIDQVEPLYPRTGRYTTSTRHRKRLPSSTYWARNASRYQGRKSQGCYQRSDISPRLYRG